MLLVKLNGIDITENVELKSIKITEQLGNRANICNFTVLRHQVPESALIEIWEGSELTQEELSASSTLHLDEVYEYFQKYRIGDEFRIPAGSANAKNVTIQSIDYPGKTVTIAGTLGTTYPEGTKVGRLIFAGVSQKNPDDEIACGVFVYKVQATDWTKAFDAKNVVDTFEDQYPREIIGRTVHKFTAPDKFLEITDAETTTGWTASGVAIALQQDSDCVWKLYSLSGGASGAGTITYKFTPGSPINTTDYTHLRTWTKIGLGDFSKITAGSVRAYTSPSDYFEWTNPVLVEDCWSYDSFEFSSAAKIGTPLQSSIESVAFIWTTNASIAQDGILIDQLSITAGGFTIRNVIRGTTKYADARAQYKKPTILMEDLAKLQKLYWYIDYEKDLHFFERETYTCPMEILDSGLVYDDLSVSSDTTQLRNRQVVRGGEAIDGSLYTQTEKTDGKMESWRLDYKPKDLEIDISTDGGTTWIPKTVGVKNLHDPADYQYLFDFNEKVVERASDGILADGVVFRRKYYPYRPIRVQVESAASINKTKALLGGDGIYDGPVINDSSIRSFEDARARAKAELAIYANAVITASWVSQQDGWHAGQIVHIQDSNRSMDDSFVIQKVDRQQKTDGVWQYSVTAGTSMFGLTEFFQLLLRRSEKMMIDVSELVDVVKTIDEEIIVTDAWIFKKKSRPWYAHSYTGQYNISLSGTEGGTPNDAYADYCEAA